jgi:hypothetical protein
MAYTLDCSARRPAHPQALGPFLFSLLLDRVVVASITISAALCLAAFAALFLLKVRAEPAPVAA